VGGDGCKDIAWFHPAGREMGEQDWFDTGLRSIGMYLDGRGLRHRGRRGEVITDDSFLLLLNAGAQDGTFALPDAPWADRYEQVVDTTYAYGQPALATAPIAAGQPLPLEARSALLLRVLRA
jgi:glycogen operon protein